MTGSGLRFSSLHAAPQEMRRPLWASECTDESSTYALAGTLELLELRDRRWEQLVGGGA